MAFLHSDHSKAITHLVLPDSAIQDFPTTRQARTLLPTIHPIPPTQIVLLAKFVGNQAIKL
jgi:hypothetical protein